MLFFSPRCLGRGGASHRRRWSLRLSVGEVPPSWRPSGACLGLGSRLLLLASERCRGFHHTGAASFPLPVGNVLGGGARRPRSLEASAAPGSGWARAHRQPARARARATGTRGAGVPRAPRGRERVPRRPGAVQLRAGMLLGCWARRQGPWRLPVAGAREAQAPAPRARRAWGWPAWGSAPGWRRSPEASADGRSPRHVRRSRGVSTRGRAPRAAPRVTAPVPGTPRRACRAATTAGPRQAGTGAWRAWARRWRRAGGAGTARPSAWHTRGGAGGGQPPAERPRRGAGPPWARPAARRAGRSQQAVRRTWASGRSRRVSARARGRSRLAAAAPLGTETAGRAPERASRARGTASRRLVGTRAPDCWGRSEGAPPQPWSPCGVRDRESQEPPGPAAETNLRGWAVAGLFRTRGSRSPCRVPLGPREVTAAPGSGATDATAMVSLWTSMPIKRVRDCDRGDLRAWSGAVATSSGTGGGKLSRGTAGVNLPPLEVIMSRP
jgi:hypothetical protein